MLPAAATHRRARRFDTTAWNDHGANPRPTNFSHTHHEARLRASRLPLARRAVSPRRVGESRARAVSVVRAQGSREKMRHLRKIQSRETSQRILNAAEERRPANQLNKRRTSLITSESDGHFAYHPFLG